MVPEPNTAPTTPALTPERVETRMKVIKRMLMVAGLFAAVGYLLVGAHSTSSSSSSIRR
jgi:hypothetical protein